MFYNTLSPKTNIHTTSGKSDTFAYDKKRRLLAGVPRINRYTLPTPIPVCLGIICLLFAGCNKVPTAEGIYIMKENRYVPLKSFPLNVNVQDVRGGLIRTYSLVDETLGGADTFKSRTHLFLIRSPYREFKIIRVNRKEIIKYKRINFKHYAYFTEIKVNDTTEISIAGDHLLLEVYLGPGRYLLIPWKRHSPFEPKSYGLIVK